MTVRETEAEKKLDVNHYGKGSCCSMSIKLQSCKMKSPRDVLFDIVLIVNIVLHT